MNEENGKDIDLAALTVGNYFASDEPRSKAACIKDVALLLARIRLDEAKWWANGEHTSKGALAMNPNQPCHLCERIQALEQAAGGSAAAK